MIVGRRILFGHAARMGEMGKGDRILVVKRGGYKWETKVEMGG
jgi:hypothetical protein